MGNSLTEECTSLLEDDFFPLELEHTVFSRFKAPSGQTYFGRQIELAPNYNHHMLQRTLEAKKFNASHYVYPISDWNFRSTSNFCSEQHRCLLLSEEPDTTLKTLFWSKKLKSDSFRPEQILNLTERLCFALQHLQSIREMSTPFDMQSIVLLKGQAFLLDPIMMRQIFIESRRSQWQPQLMYNANQSQEELAHQLLKLGLIALSMTLLSQKIEAMTHIDRNRYQNLDYQEICSYINQISHPDLRQRIYLLTHPKPDTRISILKTLYKRKSLLYKSDVRSTSSPANSNKLNQSDILSTSKDSRKVVFVQSNNSHKLQENRPSSHNLPVNDQKVQEKVKIPFQPLQNIHQNISINIVQPKQSPKQGSAIKICVPAPKIISSSNQLPLPSRPVSCSSGNKENLSSVRVPRTPKKPFLKHQFSTIKQVTEYDEENSQKKHLSQFKVCPQIKYEGNLVNGIKQGFGKCYFPEGSVYEGQWKDDQMHGFGKLYYANGSIAYQGQWAHNEFHGQGIVHSLHPAPLNHPFNYKNFSQLQDEWLTYEGSLCQDRRHGWGVLILSNGQRYEGQFKDDQVHGRGTFYGGDNSTVCGFWSQGQFQSLVR